MRPIRFGPAVLLLGCMAMAQQAAKPGAAAPAAQAGTSGAAAQTSPPSGKRAPQAQSQPEFDAYKAAMNNANDPAAMEKAADDFAAKYPKSELTPVLYRTAMHAYQNANNGEKVEAMGRKVLASDPDEPEALIAVAEVMVEKTQDSDLDRDQRLEEAAKFAKRALDSVDTDISIPAGTPAEKVEAYKGFLRSTAYAVLGTISFNRQKYPEAEGYFQQSISAFPAQPDPVVVLRLALTLDKENRYPEALKQASRAVELTQERSNAGRLARQERDRLAQLAGSGAAPPPVAPATPAPKTPAGNATPPASSPTPH